MWRIAYFHCFFIDQDKWDSKSVNPDRDKDNFLRAPISLSKRFFVSSIGQVFDDAWGDYGALEKYRNLIARIRETWLMDHLDSRTLSHFFLKNNFILKQIFYNKTKNLCRKNEIIQVFHRFRLVHLEALNLEENKIRGTLEGPIAHVMGLGMAYCGVFGRSSWD